MNLSQLAAHYGVSLTPVRLAVGALVEEGVLFRRENGRLARNPEVSPLPGVGAESPAEPRNDWEACLVQEILARSLRGSGEYLREEAVAQRHGVGRTVVRQAFSRLAGKGLLEHVPRCGWRVRAYREEEMLEYLDAREALEAKALELAQPRLEPGQLERYLAANTPDRAGRPRLDNTLHQYWIERADNYYVGDFFARYGAYFSALFDQAAIAADMAAEMAAEHREILAGLLAGDLARAQRALVAHIRSQRPNVATMFETLRQDVSGRL
jgi:DNA-binding GntR family transcriptional regulator